MDSSTADSETLRADLTVAKIVFFVIAASSPLAAMIGILPLAFTLGAGAQTPAMFVIAGVVLLLFSVGYAAMSRHLTSAGGLYTYIGAGLGRPLAVAAGLVAIVSYTALAVMLIATFAYFAQLLFHDDFGVTAGWGIYAAVAIAGAGWIGYRRIDLSAKVLGVLISAELVMLVLLNGSVLGHVGMHALPLESFDFGQLDQSALALGLMFAFTSFLGFEAAALYGEESRNPRRTVPLATYTSVAVIAVFYGLTSWITVGAIGPNNVRAEAGKKLGNLVFDVAADRLGSSASDVMFLLLLTSLFATLIACHNSANRVVFALGREGILPSWLGRAHPQHASPSHASLVQTGLTGAVVAVLAMLGLDPYLQISVSMSAFGTLGLVALQATTAAAVIGFFWRREDRHWWRTVVAPGLGAAGLYVAVALIVANYSSLTGVNSRLVNSLPIVLLVVVLIGLGYGWWLRFYRPQVYAEIGLDRLVSVLPGENTSRADLDSL